MQTHESEQEDDIPASLSPAPAHDGQAASSWLRAREIRQLMDVIGEAGTDDFHRSHPRPGRAFVLVDGAHGTALFVVQKG